jgi:hypothetical protein
MAANGENDVMKLGPNGNILQTVTVGTYPIGVAIDQSGNIWVGNYYSNSVTKITQSATSPTTKSPTRSPTSFCNLLPQTACSSYSGQCSWSLIFDTTYACRQSPYSSFPCAGVITRTACQAPPDYNVLCQWIGTKNTGYCTARGRIKSRLRGFLRFSLTFARNEEMAQINL